MLERDADGRVRTNSLSHPWQPDFANLSRREARAYVNAELRHAFTEKGRRLWLASSRDDLDGRSPEQAIADGDYEAVWSLATGMRDPGSS